MWMMDDIAPTLRTCGFILFILLIVNCPTLALQPELHDAIGLDLRSRLAY